MTESRSENLTFLLHAALDGELDAAGVMDVEGRLAADPALAAEFAGLVALRDAIRTRLPRERAPDALRARVVAMAQAPTKVKPTTPRRSWLSEPQYRALAASLIFGIVLGAGGFGLIARSPSDDEVQRAIVAGFIRGRLSGQTVDIATSDRHTVKPWFAGKIAGATTVVDLKTVGFPLVGGRVDVIGDTPVATLIYQRREHQIAVTNIAASRGGGLGEPRHETREGFSLVEWAENGRDYIAVSDLPPGELDAFCAAFRRAATAEREDTPKP